MTLNREQLSLDLRAVRVFVREWDPIGIYQDPNSDWPDDEYDSYVPRILAHLKSQGGVPALAEYLHVVRTDTMGLCSDRGADEAFAERAFAWFAERQSS